MEWSATDTKALRNRACLNDKGALYDLEDWIIEQCAPYAGMKVLDLGCGTGKQIFRFANSVSSEGLILGVDISDEAVNEVNEKAKLKQLKHVKAVKGSLDNCVNLLQDLKFDLILSSYAIYYAKDMKGILRDLRSLLNPGAHIFVCGPGTMTNQEMTDIINGIISDPSKKQNYLEDFIDPSAIKEVSTYYKKYNIVRLQNKIVFHSVDDVMQWWKNHISFVPEIYNDVEQAIRLHFNHKAAFSLMKNVLGVNYRI